MRWLCGPCARSHTLINGFISYHVLGTVALWVVCFPDATHAARSVFCLLSYVRTTLSLTAPRWEVTTACFKALALASSCTDSRVDKKTLSRPRAEL